MLNPYGVVYLPENRCKRGQDARTTIFNIWDTP